MIQGLGCRNLSLLKRFGGKCNDAFRTKDYLKLFGGTGRGDEGMSKERVSPTAVGWLHFEAFGEVVLEIR